MKMSNVVKMWTVVLVSLLAVSASSEPHFKVCVQEAVTESTCIGLTRDDSPLVCERVIDSSECAIKLAEGKADFGIFNAEELLLAYQFYPTGLALFGELRHEDRLEPFEFQSVAVVPTSYIPSKGGFGALKGKGLCHPGFSIDQQWNDYVLKYFEQKVYDSICREKYSVAENEVRNLREFFVKACRPGEWVLDKNIDAELKKKYPELCDLCDDRKTCTYEHVSHHGHIGALDCLSSKRGGVAYVALSYVKDYFGVRPLEAKTPEDRVDYQFLCPDGTVESVFNATPCAWIKQPWSTIVVREDRIDDFTRFVGTAIASTPDQASATWKKSLHEILPPNSVVYTFNKRVYPREYLSAGRDVQIPQRSCGKTIRWCTVNTMETKKCNWVATEAKALGISPKISCVEANSIFRCFRAISEDRADIMAIDSHYGYLARKVFNLTPVMFSETSSDRNNVIIAVQLDNARYKISSFKDLRKRKACFPEYGGIAWLSFVNTARNHDLISESCDYAHEVANLLGGACTPGFKDRDHSNDISSHAHAKTLCSICPMDDNCSANSRNKYYGDIGALECINGGSGDIAFIGLKNVKKYIQENNIDEHIYRVLCKNGSLAMHTGFDVDEHCPLLVTIDSEVVSRRHDKSDTTMTDITSVLLQLETWMGYWTAPRRPIHIYDPFNRTKDLLFKDSSTGLVGISSEIKPVLAYKDLFSHVDICSGVSSITSSLIIVSLGTIIFKYFVQ